MSTQKLPDSEEARGEPPTAKPEVLSWKGCFRIADIPDEPASFYHLHK
jgi:hypothetical protein